MGSEEQTQHELKRAFQVWADYAHLKFVRVTAVESADIVVLFGRGYHGDKSDLVLFLFIFLSIVY